MALAEHVLACKAAGKDWEGGLILGYVPVLSAAVVCQALAPPALGQCMKGWAPTMTPARCGAGAGRVHKPRGACRWGHTKRCARAVPAI